MGGWWRFALFSLEFGYRGVGNIKSIYLTTT
jgi:hypothetical protein